MLSTPLAAQEKREQDASKKLGPLEKSLLLPGWGQISEKHYLEGTLFLAAEALLFYGILTNNHLGNENYAVYKKAETMAEAVDARRLTEKYDTRRNQFLLAAASVWAANLVDMHIIIKRKAAKETVSLNLKGGMVHGIGLALSLGF